MEFLLSKEERYDSHWFLKSDADLFKKKMEEEIRKEAKYKIKSLNFEEEDSVSDWVDGEIKDVVRYAVYVTYEMNEDIKVVSIK